jgi:hypothetical protein
VEDDILAESIAEGQLIINEDDISK